ncbi:unnamed protein product [Eruca vesicaria subsp. sativa]|uniref:Legume lectin domain-containing protein n=1 Tax=Eruca vesicaria subsp. sativa TaxID=29727 RepID=A0ABC8M549_ERUVS|nr:unnamed protein product [Eruca vesicaria subsp. sativa]
MIFDKEVALFGDSKLIKEGSSIQLTNSESGSEGRVLYKEPINLFQDVETGNSLSFTSSFRFSMPNETDDVMAFVMVPTSMDLRLFNQRGNSSSALGFLFEHAKNEQVVAFEFDISNRGNHARILVGKPESSEVRNLSFKGNLLMANGGTLSCMIEYKASAKRMQVRFRKLGSIKMMDPSFDFYVDLAEILKGGECMVGLSSTNGNSSKAHILHSWNFDIWPPVQVVVPPSRLMHPLPIKGGKIVVSKCERGP